MDDHPVTKESFERLESRGGWRGGMGLVMWLTLCFAAAAVGARYQPGVWYEQLERPAETPPNWIFGPVWTVLYAAMAVAAWLVWKRWGWRRAAVPLAMFLLQLALNTAWSYLFFEQHRIGAALFDIVALLLSILATIFLFYPKHRVAALLLIPYLVWVSYATWLNFQFWRLNPPQ